MTGGTLEHRFRWMEIIAKAEVSSNFCRFALKLVYQYANKKTGQCNPSDTKLAACLGWSHDTLKRTVKEGVALGLLSVTSGNGRGNHSSYTLLIPGNDVALRLITASADPVKARDADRKGTQNDRRSLSPKVRKPAAKGPQNGAAHIEPKQTFEQKAGASNPRRRPMQGREVKIARDSWQARECGEWLWAKRLPLLAELPILDLADGHCVPFSTPPGKDDQTGTMIAKAFFEWAMNHKPKGAKHDRAA